MADLDDDKIDDLVLMEELTSLTLPDVDPALPEPDFFDESVVTSNVLLNQNISSSSSSFVSCSAPEDAQTKGAKENHGDVPAVTTPSSGLETDVPLLKFDDEQCDFHEFLLPNPNQAQSTSNEDSGETKDETSQLKESSKTASEAQNDDDDEDDDDDKTADIDEDKFSKSSYSGPSTPASRPDSTTVHLLSLPKPKIKPGKIIIPKESPSKNSSTSTRVTRSEGRNKRKLSDDEDYEEENDEDEEGDDSINFKRSGSGRVTRKMSRYDGQNEESSGSTRSSLRRKRQIKRPARYDSTMEELNSDSDVSDSTLFEPVVKSGKRRPNKANYWETNKTIFFREKNGKINKINYCTVSIQRLSEDEIEEATSGNSGNTSPSPPNTPKVILEICIDNFESAKEAVKGGADRIELCASLAEGGLTPSVSFLTMMKETFKNIPVFVMIRPRGGDFLYSEEEIEMMSRDISNFKQCGADGFVFGVLTKDCDVDERNNKLLKDMAYPLPCTFHRAFDKVAKPFDALEQIVKMGFNRILTSGQEATAYAGISNLKRLVEAADNRITIMAGAGINEKNVAEIIRKTGVREVHGSASTTRKSLMSQNNANMPETKKRGKHGRGRPKAAVTMGATNDDVLKVTDSDLVAQILKNANRRGKV